MPELTGASLLLSPPSSFQGAAEGTAVDYEAAGTACFHPEFSGLAVGAAVMGWLDGSNALCLLM